MAHNVRKHLHLGNDAYDEAIRRLVPGYEVMLATAADAVAAVEPALVLDLGAGTGALSEALLDRHGIGAVELLDVDPEMMAQARVRLNRFGDRARFTLRSYYEPLASSDVVTASLSLHHIPTIEAKTALFARVFDALRQGGILVNADANMPDDRTEYDRLYRYWADHLVANGISGDRARQYFEEWSDEDTYLPMETELAALESVGFKAECVWENGPMGVLVANKT